MVKTFLGLDCRDSLSKWKENCSPLACNFELLDGRLRSRRGYEKEFASSLTKDFVRGVFQYTKKDSETERVYCASDSTSGSIQSGEDAMAVIKTGTYPYAFWDSAQMNAQLFLANGVNKMLQVSGDEEYIAGMYPPESAATFNSNIDGNMSQSVTYYFTYTYYNTALAKESNRAPVSASMTTGGSAATDGIRINIPANSDLDSQVDAVRVYRTFEDPAAGNAGPYFFDQEVSYSGTAITVDSVQADDSLTSTQAPYAGASVSQASDYSVPPICSNIEEFGGSIWAAGSYTHTIGSVNVTNASTTVSTGATSPQFDTDMVGAFLRIDGDDKEYTIDAVASATSLTLTEAYEGTTGSNKTYYIYRDGTILSYSLYENNVAKPHAFPTANKEYVPELSNVVGIRKTSNYLCLFGRRQIQKIIGTYGAWQKIVLRDGVGLAGSRAHAHDGSGNIMFYSGADVYVTDGTSVIPLDSEGKLKRFFELSVDHDRDIYSHMQYVQKDSRLYLWVSTLGANKTNKLIEYDVRLGEWMLSDIPATCSGVITDPDTGEEQLVFGDEYGFVYYDKSGKNYGAGTSGTIHGIATAGTPTTLTDSTATFNTSGDGLKGVRVFIVAGTGLGEYGTIQSNTTTELTVDSWSAGVTPDTTSVYSIGAINGYYYTKVFDFDDPVAKKRLTRVAVTHTKDSGTSFFLTSEMLGLHASGTVSVTNGSATVTGSGTAFSPDNVGLSIRIDNGWEDYIITAVASETSITIDRAYGGETASGLNYQMPFHTQIMDFSDSTFNTSAPRRQSKHFQIRLSNIGNDSDFVVYGYANKHEVMDWNRSA